MMSNFLIKGRLYRKDQHYWGTTFIVGADTIEGTLSHIKTIESVTSLFGWEFIPEEIKGISGFNEPDWIRLDKTKHTNIAEGFQKFLDGK